MSCDNTGSHQGILQKYHYLTTLSSHAFNTCCSHHRGQEWILCPGLAQTKSGYSNSNDLLVFLGGSNW